MDYQGYPTFPPSDEMIPLTPQVPIEPVDPLAGISNDPQIFSYGDDSSIVMILRPREFFRKKYEMIQAGSRDLQVFTDFEHALTRFKLDSGGE